MTVLKPEAEPSLAITPRDRHASDEEWTAFLARGSQSEKFRYTLRSYCRHFVSHYPDLEDWKRRPLRQRVGCNCDPRASQPWRDDLDDNAAAALTPARRATSVKVKPLGPARRSGSERRRSAPVGGRRGDAGPISRSRAGRQKQSELTC
jgi:hypothetical protein